jgi:hypothetical protein
MRKRIRASALFYAITVALLVGMVLGSMVLLTHYRSRNVEQWIVHERLASNARSACYAALNHDASENGEHWPLDLFADGADSAAVQKVPWGGVDLVIATAWHGEQQAVLSGYAGALVANDVVLDLARSAGPLHLCGDARIAGDVRVPLADVRRGHIEGRPYSGDVLVNGRVFRSGEEQGSIRNDLAERTKALCQGGTMAKETLVEVLEDGKLHTELDEALAIPVLRYSGKTRISGLDLRGPLVIRCNDSLTIDADNHMDMVLIQAPFISIADGADLNVQCFAAQGIAVGPNVVLRFPSLLAVWRDDHQSEAARISIAEQAIVVGALLAVDRSIRGRQGGSITIASGAKVHGEVYAEGAIQLLGAVHGSVTAREFTLRTAASVYRGHLLDGTIETYDLDTPWGFGITGPTTSRTILKWGELEYGKRIG